MNVRDRHKKKHEEKKRLSTVVEIVLDVAMIFENTSFISVVCSIQKYSIKYYSIQQIKKKFFPV